MTKRIAIKIIATLLSFALGFLVCLFAVKSAKQEWREIEAKRLKQIDKLNRIIESMGENYYDMKEWNEGVEIDDSNNGGKK